MRRSIKDILIERDGMSEEEAEDEIEAAKEDFNERLKNGKMPFEFCSEWFGLEPDYLEEFM